LAAASLFLPPQLYAGLAVIQKLDACLFQSSHNTPERFRARRNRPVKALHTAYRPKRNLRFFRKRALRPAQKASRSPDVSSADDDQTENLTC
jgi:hypothetical protein